MYRQSIGRNGVAIDFFGGGRGALVQTFHIGPQMTYIAAFFRNRPNQAQFSPRHEYAHMQTAVTKLTSDSNSDFTNITTGCRIVCIAAYTCRPMLISSPILEWIHYSESAI